METTTKPLADETEAGYLSVFRFELAQSRKALYPAWTYDSVDPIIDKYAKMMVVMDEVRKFHSPAYVCKCLEHVRKVSDHLGNKQLVIAALLFHVSGYFPGDKKSFSRSCEHALDFYPSEVAEKLVPYIKVAQADWVEEDEMPHADLMFVRDIVNHPFGLPREEFQKEWGKLILEFINGDHDPKTFKRFSAQRLRVLLARHKTTGIYRTQYFRDLYEEQAADNISWLLEQL